jgi:hypothetical protein
VEARRNIIAPTGRPNLSVAAWSQDANRYRIFVERFQGTDAG